MRYFYFPFFSKGALEIIYLLNIFYKVYFTVKVLIIPVFVFFFFNF